MTMKVVVPHNSERVREELVKVATRAMEAMDGADVQIEFTDSILPSASGKMRMSIREFDLHHTH